MCGVLVAQAGEVAALILAAAAAVAAALCGSDECDIKIDM